MNKNISNIHLEILDDKRLAVLNKLLPVSRDFVLSGGTALSLQLVHRKSFDFDFFGLTPIPKNFLEKLSKVIHIENIAIDTSDELTLFTKDSIKITYLYYPFKPYFSVLKFANGLSLFPVKEIASQKAYTIGRRGEYRDYYDLYTILQKEHINLKELITVANKVYGTVFDEKIFLEQLVYFDDLTNFSIISASKASLPTPQKIKQYFEALINDFIC